MAKETKFKVGDRVVAIDNFQGAAIKGLTGTVRGIQKSGNIGIEFDVNFYDVDNPTRERGHGLNTLGLDLNNGRGWFVPHYLVELAITPVSVTDTLVTVANISKTPKLTQINAIKCIIASATYPYAALDADGQLCFYSDLPKLPGVFETASVTIEV